MSIENESKENLNDLIPYLEALLPSIKSSEESLETIKFMLRETFLVNLESYKQESLNNFIKEKLEEHDEEPSNELSRDEIDKSQLLLLRKFKRWDKKFIEDTDDTDEDEHKIKKPRKEKKEIKRGANHMSTTIVKLNEPLQKLLGKTESTRTEVVKLIWAYIRKHNLQNPEDRREVICDDQMRSIFGDKVTIFSMNKMLSHHLIKQTPNSEQTRIISKADSVDNTQNDVDENYKINKKTIEDITISNDESGDSEYLSMDETGTP